MAMTIKDMKRYGTGADKTPGKPGSIRPQGVSSRLSLLFFIALVAGLFFGYRYLSGSEALRTAEAFVRQSPEIKNAVGEVRTCRLWFPFKVDFPDDAFQIEFTLLVEGAKADTKAHVALKWEGEKWRIISASYEDGKGKVKPLLKEDKPTARKGAAAFRTVAQAAEILLQSRRRWHIEEAYSA